VSEIRRLGELIDVQGVDAKLTPNAVALKKNV